MGFVPFCVEFTSIRMGYFAYIHCVMKGILTFVLYPVVFNLGIRYSNSVNHRINFFGNTPGE